MQFSPHVNVRGFQPNAKLTEKQQQQFLEILSTYSYPDEEKHELNKATGAESSRNPVHGKLVPLLRSGRVSNMTKVRPGSRGGKKARRGPGWRNISAGTVADYGLKAWNLAKHIATLINVENKTWDIDGSGGTVITSSATVVNLSNIAQGSDYFNRIGDSILAQSVEFRANLTSNAAVDGNRLRLLIVCDKLQRGVDPVIGDVLQGGTDPMVQPYHEPQEGRFDVLYDHRCVIESPGAIATAGTTSGYMVGRLLLPDLHRKWNRHIKYQGTSGADGSNWIGGLYMMAISNDASNGPLLKYTFRLRFTDN